MNNKNSAIFLATVLVAGIIGMTSPLTAFGQGQEYGKDSYKPDMKEKKYGYDSYKPDMKEKKYGYDSYKPDMKEKKYGYDSYKPDMKEKKYGYDSYKPDMKEKKYGYDSYKPDMKEKKYGYDSYKPEMKYKSVYPYNPDKNSKPNWAYQSASCDLTNVNVNSGAATQFQRQEITNLLQSLGLDDAAAAASPQEAMDALNGNNINNNGDTLVDINRNIVNVCFNNNDNSLQNNIFQFQNQNQQGQIGGVAQ